LEEKTRPYPVKRDRKEGGGGAEGPFAMSGKPSKFPFETLGKNGHSEKKKEKKRTTFSA